MFPWQIRPRVPGLPDFLYFLRVKRRHVVGVYLRIAPVIDDRDLLDAPHSAGRSTRLSRKVVPFHVSERVFFERDGGIAALLGTIVDQTVLADIEVPRAGPASPIVGSAAGQVVLEPIQPAVTMLSVVANLSEDS